MDSRETPLLEVKDLETFFTGERDVIKAVNRVSFTVNKGETVGIVGESGSGKSVSALSIMQLVDEPGKIVGGQILFDSTKYGMTDLTTLSRSEMRNIRGEDIAMIFQEPMTSLNPVFTCGEQVVEAIRAHRNVSKKKARKQTLKLFEEVQLANPSEIFTSYPHELSGGQKQRAMIAMAMSCQPKILIADEPTTALDVTVQAGILNLMRKLRDENEMSIIFISHDLGVIAEIADRVVVMLDGKVVEQGPVWEIYSNPTHPYTKGLLACRPRLDIKLKWLPTVADFMSVSDEESPGGHKYNSVGEALLFNVETDQELKNRQTELLKNPPLLKVHNLKTYFPINPGLFGKADDYVKAVDDVSFEVYPGETVGLVGESGCGKTTLGRTILRLVEPTEGEIIYGDATINTLSPKQLRRLRKNVQIIFQDPYSSLNPRITIGEAIQEPMRLHHILNNEKQRKEKVIHLLEMVNLKGDYYSRYPHEFSGGQRQRICIARTLALEPQFVICDEMVSALDVSVQAQVLNLLNRLRNEFNLTYIFISHDLSVVKYISDRILVMNKGKIVESGYPEAIYERPADNYTKKLIDAIPRGKLEDIRKAQLQRNLMKNKLK